MSRLPDLHCMPKIFVPFSLPPPPSLLTGIIRPRIDLRAISSRIRLLGGGGGGGGGDGRRLRVAAAAGTAGSLIRIFVVISVILLLTNFLNSPI